MHRQNLLALLLCLNYNMAPNISRYGLEGNPGRYPEGLAGNTGTAFGSGLQSNFARSDSDSDETSSIHSSSSGSEWSSSADSEFDHSWEINPILNLENELPVYSAESGRDIGFAKSNSIMSPTTKKFINLEFKTTKFTVTKWMLKFSINLVTIDPELVRGNTCPADLEQQFMEMFSGKRKAIARIKSKDLVHDLVAESLVSKAPIVSQVEEIIDSVKSRKNTSDDAMFMNMITQPKESSTGLGIHNQASTTTKYNKYNFGLGGANINRLISRFFIGF